MSSDALSDVDRLRLELAAAKMDRSEALLRANALEADRLRRELAAVRLGAEELRAELARSYELGPEDEVNLATGQIRRKAQGAGAALPANGKGAEPCSV